MGPFINHPQRTHHLGGKSLARGTHEVVRMKTTTFQAQNTSPLLLALLITSL
jgi:hypothetical protein